MGFDGTLMFGTGIDDTGFEKGADSLSSAASVAVGNITSQIVSDVTSALAEIPKQMVAVGSEFEASMSQVAATMGITSAAAEFDVLSDAAKEMGEKTQFSASQAAEALNYLALAGYDAEKAVAALPTVLNVAAAGGMELAAASDMITDAMSALGLEMNEMDTFADKLAVTAQKSNTSVSQLGQAILTVGGTAKSLSGGVTEMNTALGILADNGIKGAEGGTALRNILTDIGGKTKPARAALEELGVSAYDADGNMRPLVDTFADFKAALADVSAKDRTRLLTDIFGAMDLKAVNALIDTSSERFDELAGHIDNCSGAAADMAETMNDNLKGDLTIMQSALEGLGVAAYEKFQQPMRSAVQSVTESISSLTENLKEGALSESFDKVSEGLSDIIAKASELAAGKVIPAIIEGLSMIIDYSNEILALIGGIGAAVGVIKVVPVINSAVTAIGAANKALVLLEAETTAATFQQAALASGLSLTEIAAGLFTGKLTLATAAEALFKNETIKTTAVVAASTAALAALAAVTIAAALAFKNYVDNMETAAAVDPWYEQAQRNVSAIREEQQAYEELLESKKKNEDADNAEINNIQRLWSELQTYTDTNGKVISDNERAAEIIGLLNSNYGMNISYIDGQIQEYGKLAASMDDYIAKLRLEARIRNGQDAYDEAIKQQDSYNAKRVELEAELQQKLAAFEASNNNDVKGVFAVQIAALREEIAAIDETTAMYQQTIDEYEGLFSNSFSESAAYDPNQNYADEMAALARQRAEDFAEQQKENTKLMEAEWKKAEHSYAMGVIASEEDLYAEKQRILDKYGSADCEDHWKYYEELMKYQDKYAEKQKKAAKEAEEAEKQAVKDRWESINRLEELGIYDEQKALEQRKKLFKELYPDFDPEKDYMTEAYAYHKQICDAEKELLTKQQTELKKSLTEQVKTAKEAFGKLVSEYKKSYSDINSNIESYKQKLLSVGEAFSVIENDDGSKTLKINNLKEQMAEMKKYNAYIKKLRAEGASEGLISELTAMDWKDGSAFAKNLSSMSEAEFAEINDYYKERDELAKELSTEFYQPDIDKLNEDFTGKFIGVFNELPPEVREASSEIVAAFIDGIISEGGDISEKTEKFIDDFLTACENGIENGFDSTTFEKIFDGLADQDTYSMGKKLGDDFLDGFNSAMSDVEAAVATAKANITAEYSAKTSASAAAAPQSSQSRTEKIVVENHEEIKLIADGRELAEVVTTHKNEIDREKGK